MPRRTKKQENDTINGDKFFEYFLNKNDDFEELDSLLSECEFYNTNCIFGAGKYDIPADLLDELNCPTQETRDDIHSAMKMLIRLRQMMRKCRRDSINITELFGLWLSPDYHWRKVKKAFPDESSFSKTYRVSFQYAVKYFLHVREVMFHRPELLFGSAKRAICEFISKYKAKGNDFFESESDVYHFILYTYQQFPTFVRVLTSVYNDRQNVIAAANRAFMVYNAERPQILHDAVSELHELVLCDFDVESAKVVLENYEFVPKRFHTEIPIYLRTKLSGQPLPFQKSPEICFLKGADFIYEAIEKFRKLGAAGCADSWYKFCILQEELWHKSPNLSFELLPLFELAERQEHLGAVFYLGLLFPTERTIRKVKDREFTELWSERGLNLIKKAAEQKHSVAISYLELARIDNFIDEKFIEYRRIESDREGWESRAAAGEFKAMVTLIRTVGNRNVKVEYFERLLTEAPCRESEYLLGQRLLSRGIKTDMLRGLEILEKVATEGHIGALRLLAKHYYEQNEFEKALSNWQRMMNLNWGLNYPSYRPEPCANFVVLAALVECVKEGCAKKIAPKFLDCSSCDPVSMMEAFPGILEFEQK